MEFYQHFITVDIKYNFWSDEDGHQYREDWVKCRININYIDTPSNIQIKCRALTSYDDVPLAIVINFNDFHFERVEEVDGMKQNVFAITWSPQITENNEFFFIAIDDRVQFVNYGTYLNNMIKICRIAEDERTEDYYDDYSSTSFYNITNSSLSLFSISAYGVTDRSMATEMMQEKQQQELQVKDHRHRFHSIKRVKNATKSMAKKFNHILSKAKTTLKTQKTATTRKQTNAVLNEIFGFDQSLDDSDIGIIRTERIDDDIDMIENERIAGDDMDGGANSCKEVDLNKTSTSSLHFIESSPFAVDECEWQITTTDDGIRSTSDSCMGSSCEDCSSQRSSVQLSPSLDQSTCDKSSYGSLEECMSSSSDSLSLVSLIINRSQSRSPIVFRPDFYVKKTITASNGHGHHHHQTLYQVSNDNHSCIDDYTSLIERINAKKQQQQQQIDSNGIDSTDLKTKSGEKNTTTKHKKLTQFISKMVMPSKYTKKLSSIIMSANIINVTQKFLNYVSIA